ncbi:MAG: hypothetical protein JSV80_16025 [Acidobacteriota bacterium]|nr:MAG: hypothetical protein JSV80_16025 [Acidobacteriota bacterium]
MTTTPRPAWKLVLTALAVTLLPALSFGASSLTAHVGSPIVIGDQLFAGGQIELAPVGRGELLAVRIDGRQVALVYRQSQGRRAAGAAPHFVLDKDDRGYYHLVGLRWATDQDATSKATSFQVAGVARGLSTVPERHFDDSERIASSHR